MKIFNVLKNKNYFIIFVTISLAFGIFYVYTQVLGNIENMVFWLIRAPSLNLVLFLVFDVLFGAAMTYQIYLRRQPKTCNIKKTIGASSGATLLGLLIAQCPACASLGVLLLPFSVISFLTGLTTLINIINIAVLLFVINYLGGFHK